MKQIEEHDDFFENHHSFFFSSFNEEKENGKIKKIKEKILEELKNSTENTYKKYLYNYYINAKNFKSIKSFCDKRIFQKGRWFYFPCDYHRMVLKEHNKVKEENNECSINKSEYV